MNRSLILPVLAGALSGLVFCAAWVVAAAAAAETLQTTTLGEQAAAREQFANCFVRANRAQTVRILEQVPGSTGEATRLAGAARESCYRRHLKWGLVEPGGARKGDAVTLFLPRAELRAVLAEALYKADFASSEPQRTVQLARLPAYEKLQSAGTSAGTRRAVTAGAFAGCIVGKDVASARRFLAATPRTREETVAVQGFAPVLEACLRPGEDPAIPAPVFRGYVAEALYRLSATAGRETAK